MRNFLKLASGVDVVPLLHSVQRQPELWNENKLRTQYPGSPHNDIEDIWLWFNDVSTPENVLNDKEVFPYSAWWKLSPAHSIVYDLMRKVEGCRLGRVLITRLSPGKKISPHKDRGAPAEYFERYHCVLQNKPGSNIRSGEETICPSPGDVYWFNNSEEHEVINHSSEDRITLIIDIRCEK